MMDVRCKMDVYCMFQVLMNYKIQMDFFFDWIDWTEHESGELRVYLF